MSKTKWSHMMCFVLCNHYYLIYLCMSKLELSDLKYLYLCLNIL